MSGELMVNPFDDYGFDLITMSEAINLIPNNYGRIRQMGIFSTESITTDKVAVDEVNGLLTLLQTQPKGSPAPKAKHEKAKTRLFQVPHIPYDDVIYPSDIQGVRQWGTANQVSTLDMVMARRLANMRASHAITEEHLMMGALKGTILDADGSSIYNLFTEFGVSQKTVNFALDVADTDVEAKCREVKRHIEDELKGDVMYGVHCLVDDDFFDALIGHANVEKFWVNHMRAVEFSQADEDPRKGFKFGGITFEEYRAKATDPSTGSSRAFIDDNTGHCFPVGTMDTFKLYHAPADYLDTLNTPGLPMYAKQVMANTGKWIDILTESNPLPLCRRPKLLVKVTQTS